MEHGIVFVEPGSGALIQAVCRCGELLTGFGTTSLSALLSAHIKAAS